MIRITIIFALALFTGQLLAQGNVKLKRLEGSVGFFTTQDQFLAEDATSVSSGPGVTVTYEAALPAAFIGIGFYDYKKLEIGFELGYQYGSTNDLEFFNRQGQLLTETVSISTFMVTPRIRMNWVRSDDDIFEFYSSLNVGLAFSDYEYSIRTEESGLYPQPTGHLCAAGLRFGKKFGGFFEIGIGNKGLLNFGLSYRP